MVVVSSLPSLLVHYKAVRQIYVATLHLAAYTRTLIRHWDRGSKAIFKTNVTRFTSLRTITPPVPHATLRKLIQYFPTHRTRIARSVLRIHRNQRRSEKGGDNERPPKFVSVGLVAPVGGTHVFRRHEFQILQVNRRRFSILATS